MSERVTELARQILLPLLPAALLCLPMLVWVLYQSDRRRLLIWAGCGALAGCAPGAIYVVWAALQPWLDSIVLVWLGQAGSFFGALVGAHVGAALSRRIGRVGAPRADNPGRAEVASGAPAPQATGGEEAR